jgi:uncharacterized protein (DUF58 family)
MAVEFLTSAMKRRCTAFFLSDFYQRKEFLQPLTICNRKHDVVAIQVYDQRAKTLPDVGLMKVCDAETGHEMIIDTSSKRLRRAHTQYWMNRQQALTEVMNKSRVNHVSIATDEDYVKKLMALFQMRG